MRVVVRALVPLVFVIPAALAQTGVHQVPGAAATAPVVAAPSPAQPGGAPPKTAPVSPQPQSANNPEQPAGPDGLQADWEVQKTMTAIADQVRKIEPVLAEAKPDRWMYNGAPAAYIDQVKSAQAFISALIASADRLARQPDRMTLALEAYFRMEGMDAILGSVRDGIRKYQNRELAQQLSQMMAETSNNRDKLRNHIADLARTDEQEMMVMDQEAQRCRGTLLREHNPARTAHRHTETK